MPKEQPMTPKTLGYRIPNCIGPAIFEGIRNTSRIGGKFYVHKLLCNCIYTDMPYIKGLVILEGIFNLVPSSIYLPNHWLSTFHWWTVIWFIFWGWEQIENTFWDYPTCTFKVYIWAILSISRWIADTEISFGLSSTHTLW